MPSIGHGRGNGGSHPSFPDVDDPDHPCIMRSRIEANEFAQGQLIAEVGAVREQVGVHNVVKGKSTGLIKLVVDLTDTVSQVVAGMVSVRTEIRDIRRDIRGMEREGEITQVQSRDELIARLRRRDEEIEARNRNDQQRIAVEVEKQRTMVTKLVIAVVSALTAGSAAGVFAEKTLEILK